MMSRAKKHLKYKQLKEKHTISELNQINNNNEDNNNKQDDCQINNNLVVVSHEFLHNEAIRKIVNTRKEELQTSRQQAIDRKKELEQTVARLKEKQR